MVLGGTRKIYRLYDSKIKKIVVVYVERKYVRFNKFYLFRCIVLFEEMNNVFTTYPTNCL